MMGALVNPAFVEAALGQPGTVVCDATAALPGESYDPEAAFRDAHVPGARRLDIELFADPESELPHMVPSAGRFARLAASLGIGDDSTIILYESRRLFAAPRAWWLFRLFGHDRVHILDGGLQAWRAAGGAVETGAAAPSGVVPRFTPHLRASLLAGLGDIIGHIERGDRLVLDARSPGRFDGTAPEPRPGLPSGAIPGSRNLPYTELLEPDGRMRPPDALRALFATVGVTAESDVITSCGTGVTAAVLSLGLHVAGLREGALYDGSWTEFVQARDRRRQQEQQQQARAQR